MKLDGKKVLITGGAGFIGSEVTRQLVEQRVRVTVVDNLVNGRRENLEGLSPDYCELAVVDIRDAKRMDELLPGVSVVLHLACMGVRHSLHSPTENHEVNASATLSLLESARKQNVERFVYCSSSEVYGTAKTVPMTEDHPTFPMTVYGSSKLAGECYTRAYHRTYDYPTVVVRPFNTYGPRSHHEGDSGEVIPKFMLRCMAGRPMVIFGDGMQTRDFTYVSDTARGILLAATADEAVGETINLGFGAEILVKDLAVEIQKILGASASSVEYDQPRPGDVLRLYSDMGKAKRSLGYAPEISLHEGLCKLRDWYLSLGVSPEELLINERVHNWIPA